MGAVEDDCFGDILKDDFIKLDYSRFYDDSAEKPEEVERHGNGNCVLVYLAKSKNSFLMADGWWLCTIFVVFLVLLYFFLPVC